jgi:hypothetical protein
VEEIPNNRNLRRTQKRFPQKNACSGSYEEDKHKSFASNNRGKTAKQAAPEHIKKRRQVKQDRLLSARRPKHHQANNRSRVVARAEACGSVVLIVSRRTRYARRRLILTYDHHHHCPIGRRTIHFDWTDKRIRQLNKHEMRRTPTFSFNYSFSRLGKSNIGKSNTL